MSKRQRFHITLPGGEQIWITGNTISEAFENGLKKVGGGENKPLRTTPTLKNYAEEWWTLYKLPKLKHTTLRTYRNLLDKHILPYMGGMPLQEMTTNSIQHFFNEHAYMAQSTARQMRILLHEICAAAVEDGYLAKDPTCSKRLILPTRKKMREALPTADFLDVLANLSRLASQDATLLALLTYTGMRRGEALGLQWGDLDFDTGLISIERNVTFKGNQPVVGTPKSAAGQRSIPMVKELRPYLHPKEDHLFVVGNGDTPITESAFDRAWQRIGKTVDLHGATPHIFRHTYLTIMEAAGTDVKTLQTIAGHADIQTTMNRYVHSRLEGIQTAGVAFSELTAKLTSNIARKPNENKTFAPCFQDEN